MVVVDGEPTGINPSLNILPLLSGPGSIAYLILLDSVCRGSLNEEFRASSEPSTN